MKKAAYGRSIWAFGALLLSCVVPCSIVSAVTIPAELGILGPPLPDPFPVVEVDREVALLEDSTLRFRVVDVSDPGAQTVLGRLNLNTTTNVRDIATANDLAFVSLIYSVRIIDIADRRTPRELGSVGTSFAEDLYVADGILYVADRFSLRLYDVSSRGNAIEEGSLVLPGSAKAIQVSGNRAYVGYGGNETPGFDASGLMIVDVSNPASPHEIGRLDLTGASRPEGTIEDLVVVGELVYAVVVGGAVVIIDVSTPALPRETGRMPRDVGSFASIEVSEERAFVLSMDYTLSIVDISDPSRPTEIASIPMPPSPQLGLGNVYDLRVIGERAYLADRSAGGLRILDVAPSQGCGDADGDGNVSVTDGVQTLRAATGLSSACVTNVCDVDGDWHHERDRRGERVAPRRRPSCGASLCVLTRPRRAFAPGKREV